MSVWQGLEKWTLLTAGGTVLVCSFEDNLAICIKNFHKFILIEPVILFFKNQRCNQVYKSTPTLNAPYLF